MLLTPQALEDLLALSENEHLEFKEAKFHFEFEDLVKYCAALANEGGGRLILGVTNAQPRQVVGSQAFTTLEKTKLGLVDRLRLRIEAEEIAHPSGRVVAFEIPSRPIGMPIQYHGAYWMRAGESLVAMTPDKLKRIFDETGPDFSAEICGKASLDDLDPKAIERLRALWKRKSSSTALDNLSSQQLLEDAELVVGGKITFAALILLGTREALGKFVAQSEVIFEYRSNENSLPFQQRKDYREGFFLFDEELWTTINLRNEIQHYQDGLFVWDIPTFNESVVREAYLNAVSHRDYRLQGSVFIRQYPRTLEIVSPGGFPAGISMQNILWKQAPRNRRIAEVFAKCGLVDRSGQGINRMFEESIKEGKSQPDFSRSDEYEVVVQLRCDIQDAQFLRFLEKLGSDQTRSFSTQDFLVLDLIHREISIPENLKSRLPILIDKGVVEKIGHGRGTTYILSRAFYGFIGRKGTYTRRRGLDRETNKELLLKHIRESGESGTRLEELQQVLPALSRNQLQVFLRELRTDEKIRHVGRTRGARWFFIPPK